MVFTSGGFDVCERVELWGVFGGGFPVGRRIGRLDHLRLASTFSFYLGIVDEEEGMIRLRIFRRRVWGGC